MYRLQTTDTTPEVIARAATKPGIDAAFADWTLGAGIGTPDAAIAFEEVCIKCGVDSVILRRVRNIEFARCNHCAYSYRYFVEPNDTPAEYEYVTKFSVIDPE